MTTHPNDTTRLALLRKVEEVLVRRFPMCRDCADDGPTCPHSGLPCDLKEAFDDLRNAITVRASTDARLIDRDKVWALFVDHYWDSFQKDRDLILCHVDAVLRMAEDVPSSPGNHAIPREQWEPWQTHLFETVYGVAVLITGDQPIAHEIAEGAVQTASKTSG